MFISHTGSLLAMEIMMVAGGGRNACMAGIHVRHVSTIDFPVSILQKAIHIDEGKVCKHPAGCVGITAIY